MPKPRLGHSRDHDRMQTVVVGLWSIVMDFAINHEIFAATPKIAQSWHHARSPGRARRPHRRLDRRDRRAWRLYEKQSRHSRSATCTTSSPSRSRTRPLARDLRRPGRSLPGGDILWPPPPPPHPQAFPAQSGAEEEPRSRSRNAAV